jgi:ADP-dependent NAD(P)H-hydrate dehydratase / NAD(P)H-hydrate epimerase
MRPILNRELMQEYDARTIKKLKLPSEVLMETAGARCADIILREYKPEPASRILILCGSGNNGGDGMVIARHLHAAGYSISILLPRQGRMSPETLRNLDRCLKLNIPILESTFPDIAFEGNTGLIIDALFGIGFKGKMDEDLLELLTKLSQIRCPKIAIDIPSGIDANTGQGFALQADATIAIEEYKLGHFLEQGRKHSGKLHLVKIGIPREYKKSIDYYMLEAKEIVLPDRPKDAHKGTFGKIFLIGGSADYPGSIMLSAKAALKSGAGLVCLYSRRENLPYYANPMEIMPRAIPETADGLPDAKAMESALKAATAIVVGPGMGLDPYALKVLETVLKCSEVPTVVDADAITLIAKHPELRQYLSKDKIIITPHKGEFCRLQGIDKQTLNQDIIGQVDQFRKQYKCRLLLKDHRSIYADSFRVIILASGNDALATGGSGDVLCGIIASFAAQQLNLTSACCSASLLMGKTAERLSRNRHSFSVRPTDIIEHLGDKDE